MSMLPPMHEPEELLRSMRNRIDLLETRLWNLSTVLGAGVASGYYGAFESTGTQTLAAINTAYAMTLNTTDGSNGVSVVSSSRVTFANAGVYNVQWSGQFQNTDTQDHDVKVWLRLNGTDITGSTGIVSVPSSHGGTAGHCIPSWNYVLTFAAGDYIEFYWSSDSTAVTLQSYTSGSSPATPSTASLLVTAQQITNTQQGPQGDGYSGITSTTSKIINVGNRDYVLNKLGALTVGTRVRASVAASPTIYNEGLITAINTTTKTVTITADNTAGSGTYSSWNITVAGDVGETGGTGLKGDTGASGDWSTAQTPNTQTGTSYPLVSSDVGKLVTFSSAGTGTPPTVSVTVPAGMASIGQRVDLAQLGAGQVTVAPVTGSGVVINSTPTAKLRTQWSAATLICTASNVYLLVGDLAAS
ncbi:hypothetical protein UFOVP238_40 [uncultured Caudovirales phage]|uniref:Uncharacterized protein n=1 Tax=uncultured Caudovirales phage TaxID=2100421 RepID=A0A6J7WZE6_9CAUD|nr:hypothetical protein UFOVP238_40 [uncultured Caudovirales phage]